MNNKEILYVVLGLLLGVVVTLVITGFFASYKFIGFNRGMMGLNNSAVSSKQVEEIKKEEDEGQELLLEIQSKTKSCKDVSEDDFEKIGDYVMKQRVRTSEKHAAMDANMEQMMGKDQNEQMHISLGKSAAGCSSSNSSGSVQMMNNSFGN